MTGYDTWDLEIKLSSSSDSKAQKRDPLSSLSSPHFFGQGLIVAQASLKLGKDSLALLIPRLLSPQCWSSGCLRRLPLDLLLWAVPAPFSTHSVHPEQERPMG